MKRIMIMLLLLSGVIFGQEIVPHYSNYFGITYTPYSPRNIGLRYSFDYDGSLSYSLDISQNEVNMFFSSNYGHKIKDNFFGILDLEVASGSFKLTSQNTNSTYEIGLILVTPKIGIRKNILLNGNVTPYLRFAYFQTFAFASFSNPFYYSDQDEEVEENIEKLNSPWGLELGFGTEFLLAKQFSFFLDAKFVYENFQDEISTVYNSYSIKSTQIFKSVSFGLNMYF